MQVFVVFSNSWNGEYDVKNVERIFANEAEAAKYVEDKNATAFSAYSTTYEYDSYEVI